MARRAIRRGDEAAVRARVAKACPAIALRLMFAYVAGGSSATAGASDPLVRIEVNGERSLRGLSAPELAGMARAGIHPGAEGWEMEEASADAPVPDGPPLAAPSPIDAASILRRVLCRLGGYDEPRYMPPLTLDRVIDGNEIDAFLDAFERRILTHIDARAADARGDAAKQVETGEPSRGYLLGVWEAAKAWRKDIADRVMTRRILDSAETNLFVAVDASPDAKPAEPRDDGCWVLHKPLTVPSSGAGGVLDWMPIVDVGKLRHEADAARAGLRVADAQILSMGREHEASQAKIRGLESDLEIEREAMGQLRVTKDDLGAQLAGALKKIEELTGRAEDAEQELTELHVGIDTLVAKAGGSRAR